MNIHKFVMNGRYILLDVNSSIVYQIDELIFDLLDYYPTCSQNEVIAHLKNKYNQKLILEGLEEIDELICTGKLFTKPMDVDTDKIKDGSIKALCLHVSHDCNLSCMYCFASGGDFNTNEKMTMSFDVAKQAIDFLIENSGNKINLEVDFFGGEPLMNLDVVKKTVDYARSIEEQYNKHFRFTLTTNAVLLNEETADYLNETMDNIVLSLDGRKDVHDSARRTLNDQGSYDIVVDNIKHMVEVRGDKQYFVRGTFTKDNLDFSEDVKHMINLGFKNVSVEPVVTKPEEQYAIQEEDIDIICNEYEKVCGLYESTVGTSKEFSFFHFNIDLKNNTCHYKRVSGCGAGTSYIAVTPQGDIYPCHQFVGEDKFLLGNVSDGIDQGNPLLHEMFEANIMQKDACRQCWAKYFCGGGCHANAYHQSKDLLGVYEIGCDMQKKRIECALYLQCIDYDKLS